MDDNHILESVGKNIRQARLLRGLTQEALAEKLNKSINFVSLIERGASGISLPTLVDICNVLDISPDFIFNGLITTTNTSKLDSLSKSLSMLEDGDISIVSSLVDYIVNSKK